MIRDAEAELYGGEPGSWVGGSWWKAPLLMFGDVEMVTIESREIPGDQTMDFVLKVSAQTILTATRSPGMRLTDRL